MAALQPDGTIADLYFRDKNCLGAGNYAAGRDRLVEKVFLEIKISLVVIGVILGGFLRKK
jgi:hypothetical protein